MSLGMFYWTERHSHSFEGAQLHMCIRFAQSPWGQRYPSANLTEDRSPQPAFIGFTPLLSHSLRRQGSLVLSMCLEEF